MNYSMDELVQKSQNAFEQAAKLSRKPKDYREADALTNKAWLGYYAGRDDLMKTAIEQARAAIPGGYFIGPDGEPAFPKQHHDRSFWRLLGKLEVLEGHHAYREYKKVVDTGNTAEITRTLTDASEHYTRGLYYCILFSTIFRDLLRVEGEIYERLKKLSAKELRIVSKSVMDTEAHFKLKDKSEMRKFLEERGLWYGA